MQHPASLRLDQCNVTLINSSVCPSQVGTGREGEASLDSFRGALIFPLFVIRMINVGELSGTLPEQLTYIAEDYRNKLSVLVATIGKMVEPIVLVVAGAMFAIIIAGLFLPIYDLVSQVGGG